MAEQMNESVQQTGGGGRWRGRLIAGGAVVIAGALVLLVALMPGKQEQTPDYEPTPVNVVVQTIRPIPQLPDTFTLSGVVEPESVVRVAAEVAGRVEHYGKRMRATVWREREFPAGGTIEEGEPVEEGQPLIHLNQDLLQAAFDRAQAQFKYDETEYARIADLYERGVTSKNEFDDVRTRREISQAVLDEASRNLERTVIAAPLSGILNSLLVEPGEYAVPGQQVAVIVHIDTVKVVVNIPERDVYYLHIGDDVIVTVFAPDETRLTGKITYISELADDATRTSRVEITVDNRNRLLRSGQIVRATLTRRVLTDVIMIPLASVIPLEVGRVVYIADDSHAVRREVVLGMIEGHDVEILSGLSSGDRLIVQGHRYVGPGQTVQIISDIVGGESGDGAEPASSTQTAPQTPDAP